LLSAPSFFPLPSRVSSTDPLLDAIPTQPQDAAFLAELGARLREARRWNELLEVRLMQARIAHGLPVDAQAIAEAPAPQRADLERLYTEACKEVGLGLLGEGEFRQAWFYLNTAGDRQAMRDALAGVQPDEEKADELIEIALYEGADPRRGFAWLLQHYGTCNAVTSIEGLAAQLPVADLVECATVLAEHLHAELLENVKSHIAREEGQPPVEPDLQSILAKRDWLFAHEAAHVDASHLATAVRMARVIEAPAAVRVALALADYGCRLHETLQYGDSPPFEETYPAHRLFFAAQLEETSRTEVDEAARYFRHQAEQAAEGEDVPMAGVEVEGHAPLETLLVLLFRAGRPADALQAYGQLAPPGVVLSPYAPRPLELARAAGDWQTFDAIMQDRGDVVQLAQGKIARQS